MLGIGGGFLLVPMLIYFLRVPTATVIGTSMMLTMITMASAPLLHAVDNRLVDAVLALPLMIGGVIGAQFGARTGQKMRGERLRLLLGLMVLSVGMRFLFELVVTPEDLYSLRLVRAGCPALHRRIDCIGAGRLAGRGGAAGRFAVKSARPGDVEFRRRRPRSVRHDRAGCGPNLAEQLRSCGDRERPTGIAAYATQERVLGIWVNVDLREFINVPSYLAVLSNRPVDTIAPTQMS